MIINNQGVSLLGVSLIATFYPIHVIDLWKQLPKHIQNNPFQLNDAFQIESTHLIGVNNGLIKKSDVFVKCFNPFHATDLFLYPLQASENQRFSGHIKRGQQQKMG